MGMNKRSIRIKTAKENFILFVFYCLLVSLFGCGQDNTTSSPLVIKNGRFLDSAVEGLTYFSGDLSGTTDHAGSFQYYDGDTVLFKIGDLTVGEAVTGRPVVTPLDIFPDADGRQDIRVNNIVRFFMAIDADDNPENGITIPEHVIANAPSQTVDFANETAVNNLLDVLYDVAPPVLATVEDAAAHLYKTLFYQIVEEAAVNNALPGVVLGVILPGESTPWFVTYGESNRVNHTPMTENDKFRIGSVTKTFLAITTLQLAEEGLLALDDSVERYLPGVVPNGSNITIRMLLNHTSGLFNFIKNEDFLQIYIGTPLLEMSHEAVLSYAFNKLPYFPPGEPGAWTYANTNYVVLGMVIEAVTNSSLEDVVQDRCIDALGLTSTVTPLRGETAISEPYANGYIDLFEESYYRTGVMGRDLVDYTLHEPSQIWGNGNMISSVPDLMTWITAIAEEQLLGPDAADEMFSYVDAGHGLAFGLGIAHIEALGAIGHAGQILGYDCSMIYQLDYNLPVCSCTNRTISGGGNMRDLVVLKALTLLLDGQ